MTTFSYFSSGVTDRQPSRRSRRRTRLILKLIGVILAEMLHALT
ncbi:hypothetical protein GCM10008018_60500 [Paenibacillus marchantiophytorum]|uniref:Uncharacterized protein n=1 Tax=Paenibacillus marchantiophytorum TaxID=1619310 RepID=A0ABQ1FC36_9BACL|nr:hypothetical protein [Paenibacillus marchantiophytorum]GGA06533.1 hypothetical protein GCM10008018_60500 [Paenibacillus marchantiophytorum]